MQELEIKLYLSNLPAFQERLEARGAQIFQTRTHEYNLRFDTLTGDLARSFQVLRLRQDTAAHLAYKGPSQFVGGARLRREIEVTVSNFEATRALLESLGYQVSLAYEKYRAMYELEGVEVSLDELPYGDFTEIEGPDVGSIRAVAEKLGLDWEVRVPESYTALFERLRAGLGLPFRDLVFENFRDLKVTSDDLGIHPADYNI